MSQRGDALLVLEDGAVFSGFACGAFGEATGEIAFNTSMTGYQEVLTDPSYAGQILAMTAPHIGNCGVNGTDMESRGVFARGFVVREMSETSSNWRSEESLRDFLVRHGVVAMEGVDTRRLTRHVREHGAMRAVISTLDLDPDALAAKAGRSLSLSEMDLVGEVASGRSYRWGAESGGDTLAVDTGVLPVRPRYRVVAFDSGVKYNILRHLAEMGCEVIVVPPTLQASGVRELKPDGVLFANGPGDPSAVPHLHHVLADLLGVVPVFGICLGHQMLALAVGATTYKLTYGHRGGNQPVMNLLTGRIEITSQNHGYCVDFGSIGPRTAEATCGLTHEPGDIAAWVAAGVAPVVSSERFGRVRLTHVNLNDMTVEGIDLLDTPALSVQYHPESAPGPHDSAYIFEAFRALMDGEQSQWLAASGGNER